MKKLDLVQSVCYSCNVAHRKLNHSIEKHKTTDREEMQRKTILRPHKSISIVNSRKCFRKRITDLWIINGWRNLGLIDDLQIQMAEELGGVYCPLTNKTHTLAPYRTCIDMPNNKHVVKYMKWKQNQQGVIIIDEEDDKKGDDDVEDYVEDDVEDDDDEDDVDDDEDDEHNEAIIEKYRSIDDALIATAELERDRRKKKTREGYVVEKHIRKLKRKIKKVEVECISISEQTQQLYLDLEVAEKEVVDGAAKHKIQREVEEQIKYELAVNLNNANREHDDVEERLKIITNAICCTVCQINLDTTKSIMTAAEESPIVARCPNNHGMCLECLDNCVGVVAQNGTKQNQVKCILESCNRPFEKDQISKATTEVYLAYVETVTIEQANKKTARSGQSSITWGELQQKSVVCSPCCEAMITDFDDCCDVKCSGCPAHFCGWCFDILEGGTEAHRHLFDNCIMNPNNGLYVTTQTQENLINAVWQARQFEQVAYFLSGDEKS